MDSKRKVFITRNKPLFDIYSKTDVDGKEVEVREDAEQLLKWHEISDALVAAGYYRAQLQGLSAFDKIIGGLTWCIQLCDIDLDINLLFEENLTIGKKIALTERIVKVLPSMKCPHIIEPHQIQGLDFINIYPLVQWLIKYSSEFRAVKEDELRRFAVRQYEKSHIFESDYSTFAKREKCIIHISALQNLYTPCRVRKRNKDFPVDKLEQVNSTLSEYDQHNQLQAKIENLKEQTINGHDKLTDQTDNVCVESDSKAHYAMLYLELGGKISEEFEDNEKLKYGKEIERRLITLENTKKEILNLREDYDMKIKDLTDSNEIVSQELKNKLTAVLKMDHYSEKDARNIYKKLKGLWLEFQELLRIIEKKQKAHHQLNAKIRNANEPKVIKNDDQLSESEQKEFHDRENKLKTYIAELRLELAKVNREVLRYSVAIDEVPGTAELLQYEKRFVELYNQVASKHKETKQYYILYNTLYDVKLYTSKELSLLNSILDNYNEAMSSNKKRDEFMKQFEAIVEWVNQTVKKVELKNNQEKERRIILQSEYTRLLDIQRQYAATLKNLTEQKQKIDR